MIGSFCWRNEWTLRCRPQWLKGCRRRVGVGYGCMLKRGKSGREEAESLHGVGKGRQRANQRFSLETTESSTTLLSQTRVSSKNNSASGVVNTCISYFAAHIFQVCREGSCHLNALKCRLRERGTKTGRELQRELRIPSGLVLFSLSII